MWEPWLSVSTSIPSDVGIAQHCPEIKMSVPMSGVSRMSGGGVSHHEISLVQYPMCQVSGGFQSSAAWRIMKYHLSVPCFRCLTGLSIGGEASREVPSTCRLCQVSDGPRRARCARCLTDHADRVDLHPRVQIEDERWQMEASRPSRSPWPLLEQILGPPSYRARVCRRLAVLFAVKVGGPSRLFDDY